MDSFYQLKLEPKFALFYAASNSKTVTSFQIHPKVRVKMPVLLYKYSHILNPFKQNVGE